MQDGYTGDIGDFGKYGLLRALTGAEVEPPHCLGVVWYRTPNEAHLSDGGSVDYLLPDREEEYSPCDPVLYDALRTLVMSGDRSIAAVRIREILPASTVFYESLLSYVGAERGRKVSVRTAWAEQALAATASCDLVFLDPDNGIHDGPVDGGTSELKWVRIDELRPYLTRGQSLVVYHHLGRTASHAEQIQQKREELQSSLALADPPFAIRMTRGSPRAFFVLPSPAHRARVTTALQQFLAGPWQNLFPHGLNQAGDSQTTP